MTNIFKQLPENLDNEVFEQIIQSDQIKIERIISKGHSSAEGYWYDQAQNEWVMILQ